MIRFDEETHRYFDGEKELIPVTSLLRKHGLAPDYSGIPEKILREKAERGTLIHKEIEEYCKTGALGFTDECAEFARFVEERGIEILASEVMVWNDICAGRFDLKIRYKGVIYLVDIKTTYTLHREPVMWQLSSYKKLDNYASEKLAVMLFGDDGLQFIEIDEVPREEVDRLFECERNGTTYSKQLKTVTDEQLASLARIESVIKNAVETKKKAEAEAAEIKAAILRAMEESGVLTFETDALRLTYVAASVSNGIDTARLKEDFPDLVENYKTQTKKAAYIKITPKKEKKDE